MLKGAVRQYYFDAKPFNLTTCFITNVTQNVLITCLKWQAMDSTVQ